MATKATLSVEELRQRKATSPATKRAVSSAAAKGRSKDAKTTTKRPPGEASSGGDATSTSSSREATAERLEKAKKFREQQELERKKKLQEAQHARQQAVAKRKQELEEKKQQEQQQKGKRVASSASSGAKRTPPTSATTKTTSSSSRTSLPSASSKATSRPSSTATKTSRPSPPASGRSTTATTAARTQATRSSASLRAGVHAGPTRPQPTNTAVQPPKKATTTGVKKPAGSPKAAGPSKITGPAKGTGSPRAARTTVSGKAAGSPKAAAKSKLGAQKTGEKVAKVETKEKDADAEKKLIEKTDSQVSIEIELNVSGQSATDAEPHPSANEQQLVDTGIGEIPERPLVDDTSLESGFAPGTAERVGQIISTQTSLPKELQSKLPRVGDIISHGEQEAERVEDGEKQENLDIVDLSKGEPEVRDREEVVHEEGESGELTVGEGVKEKEKSPTREAMPRKEEEGEGELIPLGLSHDLLPEEFGVAWKQQEDERKRKEEQERAERRKRVDEIMQRTRAAAQELEENEGKSPKPLVDLEEPPAATETGQAGAGPIELIGTEPREDQAPATESSEIGVDLLTPETEMKPKNLEEPQLLPESSLAEPQMEMAGDFGRADAVGLPELETQDKTSDERMADFGVEPLPSEEALPPQDSEGEAKLPSSGSPPLPKTPPPSLVEEETKDEPPPLPLSSPPGVVSPPPTSSPPPSSPPPASPPPASPPVSSPPSGSPPPASPSPPGSPPPTSPPPTFPPPTSPPPPGSPPIRDGEGEQEEIEMPSGDALISFESEETTTDVLKMLPEDDESEIQQIVEDTTQRLERMEMQAQEESKGGPLEYGQEEDEGGHEDKGEHGDEGGHGEDVGGREGKGEAENADECYASGGDEVEEELLQPSEIDQQVLHVSQQPDDEFSEQTTEDLTSAEVQQPSDHEPQEDEGVTDDRGQEDKEAAARMDETESQELVDVDNVVA